MATEQPELRTERMTVAVTAREKRAYDLIARVRSNQYDGPSTVLRDMTPSEAVAVAEEIEAAFAEVEPVG